jgi:hypothetical protein
MNALSTTQIRAEIVELINGGILNVPKLVKFFKDFRPGANPITVKTEATELVAEVRAIIKRGY